MAEAAYSPKRFDVDGPTEGSMTSIDGLVLHHTGPWSTVGGIVNALTSRGLGAHYVMDRDGEVYRIVPEGAKTWHAGPKYNGKFEGIEVMADHDGDITPEQIEGFRKFEQWHSSTYGYTVGPKTVLAHGEIASHKRQTEGATLKWTFLQSEGFDVPASVKVGDKGNGKPGMLFADAPAWVRRPGGSIPEVASQTDTAYASTSLGRLESTRNKVLASSAIYGVPVPGYILGRDQEMFSADAATRDALTMTAPIDDMALGFGAGADGLHRLSGARDRRLDPIGDGPISWFGSALDAIGDVALDGIGGTTITSSGRIAEIDVPLPRVRPEPPLGFDPLPAPAPLTAGVPLAPVEPPAAATPDAPLPAPAPLGPRVSVAPVPDLVAPTLDIETVFGPPSIVIPKANPNSLQRLQEFTGAVYGGILPVGPGDEDLETAYDPSVPVKLRNPTVIPKDEVGRWEISPVRVASDGQIKAPKLTTAIAFDPMFSVKQTFSTGRNADMALAFDRFTLPPAIAPKPSAPAPRPEFLDGPEWGAFMERREEWMKSRPAKKSPYPVAAPTESKTREEQNASRPKPVPAQTSTSTVKTPTKPGITGEVKPTTQSQPAGRSRPPVVRKVETQPSTKPTTRTIKVENPAWQEWNRRHGTKPIGADALKDISEATTRDEQRQMRDRQPAAPVAPIVPPAPQRFIEKRVPVPSTSAPAKKPPKGEDSALSGGLYVVAAGDTLSAISRRSGVSVETLARINGIANPNVIITGQKLRLSESANPIAPSGRGTSDATTAATRGAERGRTSAAASLPGGDTGGGSTTFKGSDTGRTFVVGQVYVNSQGVSKVAMPDGTFKRV